MRVTLLFVVLLFAVVVMARRGGRRNRERFGGRNMTKVAEKLGRLRKSWQNKLKLNETTAAELGEKMKSLRQKHRERIRNKGDTLSEVNELTGNEAMYQGDIVLTDDQAEQIVEESEGSNSNRAKRQAYRDRFYPGTLWDNSVVYYYFDRTASTEVKNVFAKAAAIWQANSCITFQESSTARNRIRVFKDQGCYSYIGKIGGVQDLSLGDGCESVGTAAHEIGHALGFFHTQSRYDRDNSIIVNINNVVNGFVDQFDKETSSTNYNYGLPYDYGSIMQYGALSASRNNNPTMVAKDTNYQDTMGADKIGFYDLLMMNEHYGCTSRCPTSSSAQCTNGGFPNPRNCQTCVCPSGYGGTLCNQRPSGCGRTLTPTTSYQTLSDTIGDGRRDIKDEFATCNYWIQAPVGSRIEVRLQSFSGVFTDGCVYGGVEIKTNVDQRLTGYTFCDNDYANKALISTSHIVPIITTNRYRSSTSVIQYRLVGGSTGTAPAPAPVSSCTDADSRCATFASNGFCSSAFYTTAMKTQYCAATCNLC